MADLPVLTSTTCPECRDTDLVLAIEQTAYYVVETLTATALTVTLDHTEMDPDTVRLFCGSCGAYFAVPEQFWNDAWDEK